MSVCYVYRGFHSEDFTRLLSQICAEDSQDFLVLCPPRFSVKEVLSFAQKTYKKEICFWDTLEDRQERYTNPEQGPEISQKFGLFTSGTTSLKPRLILYTYENFRSSCKMIYSLFKSSQNIFCYPQPYHIFGLSLGYIYAQEQRKNLIVPLGKYSKKAHALWLDSAQTYEDLITLGTPTHFMDLMAHQESLPPSTYSCILGGALVSQALWHDVKTRLAIQEPSIGYGCTEASPGLFHLKPGQAPKQDGEVGEVLKGIEISFCTEGGFYFEGPNRVEAYIDQDGLNLCERIFVPDVLETSDQKHYHYRSRLGEVINRGGEKFFPQEIEAHFKKDHEFDVLCLKSPDSRLGEDFSLVILGGEHQKTLEDVQNIFFNRFKRKLQKNQIFFLSEFPLNDSAKVDRKACWTLIQKKKK